MISALTRRRAIGKAGSSTLAQLTLTQVGSDTFTRSNGTIAGSNNWLATFDGSMSIVSNAATGVSNVIAGNYRSEIYSNDQYASCTLGTVPSSGFIGVTVRNNASGNANYAAVYFNESSSHQQVNVYKRSGGGGYSVIAEHDFGTNVFAAGTVMTLVVEGSQLTVQMNGVGFISLNDSSITSGAPGIISFDPATITNWSGGNAHTGAVTATIATDSFTRANGFMSAGQANWQTLSGTTFTGTSAVDPSIVSNQLAASTGFHAAAVRTDITAPNQWSQLQMGLTTLTPGGGGFVGLLTRMNGSPMNSGYLGVAFAASDQEGTSFNALATIFQVTYRIYRIDSGVSTILVGAAVAVDGGTDPFDPTGTSYMLVSQGNRHSFRTNNAEVLAVTDTTYSTGSIGLMLFPPSTADNWSGGNV